MSFAPPDASLECRLPEAELKRLLVRRTRLQAARGGLFVFKRQLVPKILVSRQIERQIDSGIPTSISSRLKTLAVRRSRAITAAFALNNDGA